MENGGTLRILMFPWLAHGHIGPFLELAKKLTKRNFIIHLCSTPANLGSVRQKIGEKFSSTIQTVELHLPTLSNLPPHYHTTNGLPPHLMCPLKEAFEMASPDFYGILKKLKPDLLIYDSLQPWAPEAASSLNIPAVEFICTSATMTAFMLHDFKNSGMKFPFSRIFYRHYESKIALANKLNESTPKHNGKRNLVVECLEKSSKIVLVKSIKEVEGKYFNYLSRLSGKKVVPTGPLVQDPTHDDENSEILEWLNKKKKSSTIFVAFGSEYFLSNEDREEIASGLELSNVNFIWVIRFPKGNNLSIEEALPKGFFDRIGNRGKVVHGWAPQAKILSHSSIGGFVSHCGWSSIMESIKFGVPIIAMPMHLDQPLNARLVEEVGVGVEVVRDENGRIQREEMAKVIKEVVKEKSGESVREKAKLLCERIELKGEEEMDEVVKELVKLCKLKKNGFH